MSTSGDEEWDLGPGKELCYGLDVPHAIGLHPDQCKGCAGSSGRIADDPEHIGQVAADRAVFEAKAIPDRDEWKYGPRFSEKVATGERADEIEAKLRTNVDPWSYSDRRMPFPWAFLGMLTILALSLMACMYLVVLQLPRP